MGTGEAVQDIRLRVPGLWAIPRKRMREPIHVPGGLQPTGAMFPPAGEPRDPARQPRAGVLQSPPPVLPMPPGAGCQVRVQVHSRQPGPGTPPVTAGRHLPAA